MGNGGRGYRCLEVGRERGVGGLRDAQTCVRVFLALGLVLNFVLLGSVCRRD